MKAIAILNFPIHDITYALGSALCLYNNGKISYELDRYPNTIYQTEVHYCKPIDRKQEFRDIDDCLDYLKQYKANKNERGKK